MITEYLYDKIVIIESSNAIGANSLREGYLKFGFIKNDNLIEYKNGKTTSLLYVFIRKVN